MPPHPTWYAGRDAIVTASQKGFDPAFGRLRSVVVGSNMQPAAAHYLCPPGGSEYRPLAFDVLRVEDGRIAEIASFAYPELFPAFGLRSTLR
jgi:RNA polymerase sigma-70 factor, ECF subfamily